MSSSSPTTPSSLTAEQQRVLTSITNISNPSSTPTSFISTTALAQIFHHTNTHSTRSINRDDPSSLSPFDKIKLDTDRKTAHGHPLILPTEYGKHGPVFDVIALYHNAIKRQTIVAYNLLEALHRFKYEVTLAETNLFLDWFHIFQQVVETILDVEEQLVFPFLEQNAIRIPDCLNKHKRNEAKQSISKALDTISENLQVIRLLAAGESVARLSSMVREFLQLLLDYFEVQRTSLPDLINVAAISPHVAARLHVRFVRTLLEKDNAGLCLPFVSHWLSHRQLAAWKKANFNRLKALHFDKWKKRFSSIYQEIPVTIMNRLTTSSDFCSPRSITSFSPTSFLGRKNRYSFR